MTRETWDTHWYRIRGQLLDTGCQPTEAAAMADVETAEQFGTRPTEETG